MLGLLPCLLSRLSLTSLLKFHQCGSRVVDFAYKLKEINLRLITRRKINMSHAFSIWALQKIRPRPRGVKMKMCRFSSTRSGGKVANAALPLLTTAVKLQMPVFLHSERRKTCKCRFPLLITAVKLRMRVFRHLERRRSCLERRKICSLIPLRFLCSFPPLFFFSSTYGDVGHLPRAFSFCTALTHHHNGARRMTNPNGSHIEDAP